MDDIRKAHGDATGKESDSGGVACLRRFRRGGPSRWLEVLDWWHEARSQGKSRERMAVHALESMLQIRITSRHRRSRQKEADGRGQARVKREFAVSDDDNSFSTWPTGASIQRRPTREPVMHRTLNMHPKRKPVGIADKQCIRFD